MNTRQQLEAVYERNRHLAHENNEATAIKKEVIQKFRSNYQRLKADWQGYRGYDAWVADANNATFGAQAAYDELVPGFEALFQREGRDWPRFYEAVKRLADLPVTERADFLKHLSSENSFG